MMTRNVQMHRLSLLRCMPVVLALGLTPVYAQPAANGGATDAVQPAPANPDVPAPATAEPAVPPAEATPAAPPPPADDLWTRKYMLGDLGGARTELKNMGIDLSFSIGTMSQINFRGGQNTHNAHETAGRSFIALELDFEKMGLWKGGSFFVRGLQSFNSGIGPDVGSLVPPYFATGSSGDIEIVLDKYWYRQRWFDDRIEMRLGKLQNFTDLFDTNTYADNYMKSFMNRALNHNLAVPSTKGMGAFLKVWPAEWLYAQMAAMDPDTDEDYNRRGTGGWHSGFHDSAHYRGYWELGVLPQHLFDESLPGKYALGWWYDGSTKNVFRNRLGGALSQRTRNDDVGFYVNIEQMVWKENAEAKDKQGLGVFARYGFAHEEVNRIGDFWSLGAVYLGLIPERDKDQFGVGMAQSIQSDRYQQEVNPLADRETVYELYYTYEVTPWFSIAPDLQFITNPGGNDDARDAVAGGIRVKLVF